LIEAMQNKRDLRVVLYLLPLKHYHLQWQVQVPVCSPCSSNFSTEFTPASWTNA
jgi:hypothetical protein